MKKVNFQVLFLFINLILISELCFLSFTVSFTRLNRKIKKNAFLPVLKYADFPVNEVYTITRIKRVTNDFGPTIVLDLNNEFTLYLPKRTVELFNGPEGAEDFATIEEAVPEAAVGFKKISAGNHEFIDLA